MDNTFITRYLDWEAGTSRKVQLVNRAFKKLGKRAWLRAPGSTGYMTNLEVRMNAYHLVSQVLAYDVPGELVELGTFVGHTAILIANVLKEEGDGRRKLHVYDAFAGLWNEANPLETLKQNFARYALPLPEVHAGWFADTLPHELPEQICFAHVDCGWGGDPKEHGRVLIDAMNHLYRRLSRGAVCSFIDYGDPTEGLELPNPGVKPAVDAFLADKPETISKLYAAEYGHAYFRKL